MTNRLRRWAYGKYWLNRPTYWFYRAACAVRGHNYDQHWTAMGLALPQDNERPWCDRCGGERP